MEMTLRQLLVDEKMDHRDFPTRGHVERAGQDRAHFELPPLSPARRLPLAPHAKNDRPPAGVTRLRDGSTNNFNTDLPGGLLESLGSSSKTPRALRYPALDRKTGTVITVDNLEVREPPPSLRASAGEPLHRRHPQLQPDYLATYSTDILKKIKARDASWKNSYRRRL